MFSVLQSIVSILKKNRHGRPSACGPRRASLSIECLEERQLLSGSGFATLITQQSPITQSLFDSTTYISVNQKIDPIYYTFKHVTDFQGVGFAMVGEDGTSHQLNINTQVDNPAGVTATFTGLWDANKSAGGVAVSGKLTIDGSNTDITFSWTGSMGNVHTFTGIISGVPGSYRIAGTVYVNGVKGGPGITVGNQLPTPQHTLSGNISTAENQVDPAPVAQDVTDSPSDGEAPVDQTDPSLAVPEDITDSPSDSEAPVDVVDPSLAVVQEVTNLENVSFTMTGEDGTTHQLTIQTQVNSEEGTATFIGVWDDGAAVTGTLGQDANGNISISFTWGPDGDHQFDGTLSGDAFGLQIEGMVSVNGDPTVGPEYVYGNQVL